MKQIKTFMFFCAFCVLGTTQVLAASLDDLYRDIIRSDNRGYLPLFVKNRKTLDMFIEEDDLSGYKEIPFSDNKTINLDKVSLSTKIKQRTTLAKARQTQWLKAIAAVQADQVTPLELNEITTRVRENDPKATEILAWMYTNGVGVTTDFVEAFNLYKKAAQLNVANAEKNALTVYKSMSEEERRQIRNER